MNRRVVIGDSERGLGCTGWIFVESATAHIPGRHAAAGPLVSAVAPVTKRFFKSNLDAGDASLNRAHRSDLWNV